MGYILRERPAANIMFGALLGETFHQLGAGSIAGSVNVGGTPRFYYQPIVICCCDYFLIGDELYTAAAVVDETPPQLGSVYGQDLGKLLFMALLFLSVILATVGTTWFTDLIDW